MIAGSAKPVISLRASCMPMPKPSARVPFTASRHRVPSFSFSFPSFLVLYSPRSPAESFAPSSSSSSLPFRSSYLAHSLSFSLLRERVRRAWFKEFPLGDEQKRELSFLHIPTDHFRPLSVNSFLSRGVEHNVFANNGRVNVNV